MLVASEMCCFNNKQHTTFILRAAREKQTLWSFSLSYSKKDGGAWPRPLFFWYDTDFSEFDSADIKDYILEKSVSCQNKDGCSHAPPPFFCSDNDKDFKVCFPMTLCVIFQYHVNMDI